MQINKSENSVIKWLIMKFWKLSHLLKIVIIGSLIFLLCLLVFVAKDKIQAEVTTYYIDPACAYNGDGEASSCALSDGGHGAAKNFLNIDWQAGNTYLLKRNTVLKGQIAPLTKGTQTARIVIGAYGSGDKPIIRDDVRTPLFINNRNYLTIEDIRFEGIGQHSAFIMANWEDLSNLTIRNCDFYTTGNKETHGVYFYQTEMGNITNLLFENNNIQNLTTNPQTSLIRFYTANTKTVRDSIFRGNNLHDSNGTGIMFFSADMQTLRIKNNRPYGLDIDGNKFANLKQSAISMQTGIKNVKEHPSYIRNNYVENIGDQSVPYVNALQLHWVDGVEISGNTIKNVKTSRPDGEGIILDWLNRESADSTCSTGNKVYNNYISGCRSGMVSAGINIWCGKNNLIYRNIVTDNNSGIRIAQHYSSGNAVYNNLIKNNIYGSRVDDPDNIGAPASAWTNNVIINNKYGMSTSNRSVVPSENYNVFYGSLRIDKIVNLNRIALNQKSFVADPKLQPDSFIPAFDSPVIDASATGVSANNATDYYGHPIYGLADIGPIEYQPPFTMGVDAPDVAGDVRIYRDGKFRNRNKPSGQTAALAIKPIDGFIDINHGQWMDLKISEWGPSRFIWTASCTNDRGATITVSKLEPGRFYQIKTDGVISGGISSNFIRKAQNYYQANHKGELIFMYNGGGKEHQFSLEIETAVK